MFHDRNSSSSPAWGRVGLTARSLGAGGKGFPLGSNRAHPKRFLLPLGPGAIKYVQPLMNNIVYFDLETQKSAEEVGGWDKISRMLMSIGVTYSTATGGYKIYGEKQVDELIKELQRADLVVGFNNLRFDYEVLHGYTTLDLRQLPTLDMLVELQNTLNHRLSLDSIATATFGVEKTAEGLQAIEWFKQGKLVEIAEYCCYDVKITKLVHEYGVKHKQLHYSNRFGKKMTVPVKW
jgi:DEAD/DEAH box helicase domain-containing protein